MGIVPVLVLLALAVIAAPAQAGALHFTVNSTGDAPDANPGDGTCATAGSVCTLRAAIEESNALGGGAVVGFAASVTGQIVLTSELPSVTHGITIQGPGASQLAVDGGNTFRVLETFSGTTGISGLTIRHGLASGATSSGGAMTTGADVTLDRVVLTQNTSDGQTDAFGGGISVEAGTLTLRRTTVSGNTATTSGASATQVHAYGGGIAVFSGAALNIDHSTISGNTASGVVVTPAPGTQASGHGGGIYGGAPVQIDQSTVSGNTASGSGGTSSNIGSGGGYYEDNSGTLTITGSTFSDNTVAGSGVFTDGASIALVPTPGATVGSSIIANPTGGNDCVSNGTPLVSNGYNLDEDGSCGFNQTTDRTGDPMLGPLADNGGPTQTMKLFPGSQAIDKGKSFGATTDQRGFGFPRISDSPTIANAAGGNGADIGAYERDVAANKPVFTGSVPKSPANSNHPKLHGLAEAGSHVRVYKGSCTGTPVATGSAATFRSPGIAVSVPDNSSTVFRAAVTDASNNKSACSNAFTYVEDSKPPNTTITSATITPANHHAAFSFSSSEPGSKFQCKLDGQPYASCPSPKSYSSLSKGSHTFRVRAVDQAGNMDPTPASRSFTI